MAKQTIGIGTVADDGTGDTLRVAFDKCNDNFNELYTDVAAAAVAGDPVFINEQASASADVAGDGQFWVINSTPNRAMFTDDSGQDFDLQYLLFGGALSDETTDLTTGQKFAVDMPVDFTATRVYASVTTPSTGSAITVDVEDEGVSILNAVLSITAATNNAETSTFASAATSYAFTKGDLLTIDVDAVGATTAGAGLKVFIEGYRT